MTTNTNKKSNTKATATKKAAPAKAKTQAKATPAKNAGATPKTEKAQRFIHNLTTTYNGASTSFGKNRSRTRIAIESFDTKSDAPLTARDNAFIGAIKAQYGINAEFQRGDADAGNMRRAIERGYMQHKAGDPASDTATYILTDKCNGLKFA